MGNSDSTTEFGDDSLNHIDSFDLSTSFDLIHDSNHRVIKDENVTQLRTLPVNGRNGFNFVKRRPSLDFYDSHSPKLQPFPTSQRLSGYKRSHSESSVFRRRVFSRESNKSKPNGRLSWMQTSKLRLDQLLRKSHLSKKKSAVNVEQIVQKCVHCQNGKVKEEWKEKLESWAESLRQAIEIINREEKMRFFIQSLQNENVELKNQLNNMVLECNEWKTKFDVFANTVSIERKLFEQETHLFCHHCMNNNHLDLSTNSLCHLLDLDNLTSELNTVLSCDRCCQTCRTIAGQLLKRLHF